ncbi:hypothetical protein H8958_013100 [Nasalis larvatus]
MPGREIPKLLQFNLLCGWLTQDLKTKKHHIPVVDRTPLEPPLIVVVVMGPPKVGKSTLIQCLIRNFTRQKLTEIRGPVTIVSVGYSFRKGLLMPKEEKQMDLKMGRMRRKAIFGDDESGDSDEEDDEMSEEDELENGSSDEEAEEEEDAEMTDQYMAGKGVKRWKLEELEEDSEMDLPAFADSDDDLERSSAEEGEAEEADESSEEEDCTAGERGISESKAVGEGSKAGLSPANRQSDHVNLEKSLLMKKAALLTSDSGHCTAEEAFASEDESEESSSLGAEEEDSENEEAIRKKLSKPSQVSSGQKLGPRNLIDETSDIEDLLKEEEDYKEENNDSKETSGALKWKEDLSRKAAEAFLRQQQAAPNLRKLIYGTVAEDNEEEDGDTREELGGLFRVNQPDRECKHKADSLDCSRFLVEAPHD